MFNIYCVDTYLNDTNCISRSLNHYRKGQENMIIQYETSQTDLGQAKVRKLFKYETVSRTEIVNIKEVALY